MQLYSSVLTFAPAKSLVRESFDAYRAKWISRIPNIDSQWSPCLQTLEGHGRSIQCVSFASDGILASADEANIIKVWDPIAGTCLQTFSIDGQWDRDIITMTFSKAGKLAFMADGSLSVWDIRRDGCSQTFDFTQYVQRDTWHYRGSVVFEDERRLLLAGAGLHNVIKLELGQGCEEESNLPFHSAPTILSPDGQWVAYAIQDEIRILGMNSKTTRSPKLLKGSFAGPSNLTACFSQDNRYFAADQGMEGAMVWDVSSTICLQAFSDINDITALTFSQDSCLLVMGHLGGKISIWDWKKHSRLQVFSGHRMAILSLSFSPNGAWLASASDDGTVKIWDAIQDDEEENSSLFSSGCNAMATGGQRLATISAETSGIQIWDDTGNKCIAQPFRGAYDNIAISANGSIFAAVSYDKSDVEIWDAESEKFLPSHTGASSSICSIALSANGERFIIGLSDSAAEVWESHTGRLLKQLKHEQNLHLNINVAISCDGQQFAWTALDNHDKTSVYTERLRLRFPGEFQSVLNISQKIAFSENGKRLTSVSAGVAGAVWDVATGTCLRTFDQTNRWTWSLNTSFVNFDITVDVDSPEYTEYEDYLTEYDISPDGVWLVRNHEKLVKSWKDCLTKYYISPDGAWIMRDHEKLLWILPEYRPKAAIVSGSKIAIERVSGTPFVIKISDEDL